MRGVIYRDCGLTWLLAVLLTSIVGPVVVS